MCVVDKYNILHLSQRQTFNPFQDHDMLNYFETLRDIFADECHPTSEEDWAKTYEEHGEFFKEANSEFDKLWSDFQRYREVRNGYSNRDAKYPWGFVKRIEAIDIILSRLAGETYHDHHDWQEIYSDMKYVLGWYDKKLADRRKRKREARKQQKLSRNLT